MVKQKYESLVTAYNQHVRQKHFNPRICNKDLLSRAKQALLAEIKRSIKFLKKEIAKEYKHGESDQDESIIFLNKKIDRLESLRIKIKNEQALDPEDYENTFCEKPNNDIGVSFTIILIVALVVAVSILRF